MPEVKIVGVDAVIHLANKYSWNVYVGDYSILKIIAYKQKRTVDGYYQTDTSENSEHVFQALLSLENDELCSIALDTNLWYAESWIDHDDWIDATDVTRMYVANNAFAEWFENNIVDYVEEICV